MRVLLLDDDLAVRDILSRGLTRFGNEVAAVCTLGEARAVLTNLKPDCAILDMVLASELGIELVPDLHKIDPKMPIIFITGNPDHPAFRDAALAAAIFSMLEKPVSLGRLKTIMEWAAEKRKESDRPRSDQLLAIRSEQQDELKELVKTAGWQRIVAYVAFVGGLIFVLYFCFDTWRGISGSTIESQTYIDSFLDRIDGYLKRDEMRELFRSKDQKKLR